ncbi:MAG: hypothetical protein WBO37_15670 [Gammaproteobacteria bacterium]
MDGHLLHFLQRRTQQRKQFGLEVELGLLGGAQAGDVRTGGDLLQVLRRGLQILVQLVELCLDLFLFRSPQCRLQASVQLFDVIPQLALQADQRVQGIDGLRGLDVGGRSS